MSIGIEEGSPFRIDIRDDYVVDGIQLYIVHRIDHSYSRIMRVGEHGLNNWEEVTPGIAFEDPTIILPSNIGRALLEALLRHYAGSQDLHTARADLLHERGRVDRLIGMFGDAFEKVIEL